MNASNANAPQLRVVHRPVGGRRVNDGWGALAVDPSPAFQATGERERRMHGRAMSDRFYAQRARMLSTALPSSRRPEPNDGVLHNLGGNEEVDNSGGATMLSRWGNAERSGLGVARPTVHADLVRRREQRLLDRHRAPLPADAEERADAEAALALVEPESANGVYGRYGDVLWAERRTAELLPAAEQARVPASPTRRRRRRAHREGRMLHIDVNAPPRSSTSVGSENFKAAERVEARLAAAPPCYFCAAGNRWIQLAPPKKSWKVPAVFSLEHVKRWNCSNTSRDTNGHVPKDGCGKIFYTQHGFYYIATGGGRHTKYEKKGAVPK